MKSKDQENPNFSAFDTLGSLSNDPVFDPGRLGKCSDGTKIKNCMQNQKLKELKNSLYGRCKKRMLNHSIGIKMQINNFSSFLLKLHEKSDIVNLIRELCIPVLALKCHY